MNGTRGRNFWAVCGILFIAIVKTFFLLKFRSFDFFNADQAVLGLMAKHILEKHPMIYYYGQGYMGSWEAFVGALLFKIGGMNIITVQLAPFLSFLGFLVLNYFLLLRLFDFVTALTTSLFLAAAPPALSVLSITALGGYPETLFFGTLTLWLLVCWREKKDVRCGLAAGFAAGLGFWVNNLIIFYFFAAVIFIFLNSGFRSFFRDFKSFRQVRIPEPLRIFLFFVNFFLLFYFIREALSFLTSGRPLVFGSFQIPLSNLPFHVKKLKNIILLAGAEWLVLYFYYAWPERFKIRARQILPLVFGFTAGSSPAWLYYLLGGKGYRLIHGSSLVLLHDLFPKFKELAIEGFLVTILGIPRVPFPLQGLGLFFCVTALIFYFIREGRNLLHPKQSSAPYAVFPFYLTVTGFLICLFNNLIAMRYLLPLYSAVPFMMAWGLRGLYAQRRKLFFILAGGVFFIYAAGNIQLIREPSPIPKQKGDYQNLISYLHEQEIRGMYADYWISYMVTFLSQESIIAAPYQSHDRYPAYTEHVKKLKRMAYVFRGNTEANLFAGKIESQKQIGELQVFIVSEFPELPKP